jgi:hypothetical protein
METLHLMHSLILRQQKLIEAQIELLGNIPSSETTASADTVSTHLSNFADTPSKYMVLKQRLECYLACESPPPTLLLIGEKESPSAVFLKYSQQLLKWVECELMMIRELQRVNTTEDTHDALTAPTQEELEIIHRFLAKNQSFSTTVHR